MFELRFQDHVRIWMGREEENPPQPLLLPRQVHGTTITDKGGEPADGILTDKPNTWVGVKTADCLPLLLVFSGRVMAIHAGWRGLKKGIIKASKPYWKGNPLFVFIGPAIGSCCYEVKEDVARFFPSHFHQGKLDLRGVAESQLQALGIPSRVIHHLPWCTYCSPLSFPSFRRDGEGTGRLIHAISFLALTI